MRNEFNQKDKMLFSDLHECWNCSKNHVDCLHHIVGRGGPNSNLEGSIYNAAPLNNEECHIQIHGRISKDFSKMKFLTQTKKFLDSIGYNPTIKDIEFLEKYKKLYGR